MENKMIPRSLRCAGNMTTGAVVVFLCSLLGLSSCNNALLDAAKEIQEQTITPVIVVSLAADCSSTLLEGATVTNGTTLNLGSISKDAAFLVKLSIANNGKTPLAVADNAVSLSGLSGWNADKFSITQTPSESIPPGGSGEVWITLDTSDVLATVAANLGIATNDVNTPAFNLKLASAVVATPTPDATTLFSVDSPGSEPANYTTLKLTWNKVVSNTTGYSIMRSTSLTSGFTIIKTIDSQDTITYDDDTCKPGTTYYYRLYSVNGAVYSTAAAKDNAATTGTAISAISIGGTSLYDTGTNSSATLAPIFTPANPSITTLDWSSSNPSVATVLDGTVSATGTGYGTTTITATSKDNTAISTTCTVTVTAHQVLYLANFGGNLDTDFINPTTWVEVQLSNALVGSGPSCTAVDASGKFLYETNSGTNPTSLGVDGYAINQTSGAIGFINGVYAGILTEGLAVASPNGPMGQQFIYCTFRSVGQVGAFAINNSTGVLSYLPIGSAPPLTFSYLSDGNTTSGNPRWLAVDPLGKYLYVSNTDIDKISLFSINATTGALAYVDSYTAGDYPYKSAVSPDGKYLYVVNFGSSTVSAFSIDAASGVLTTVGTYATGSNPTCIAIDPLQRYAYVTNGTGNTITAYTINAGTGALAPVNGTVAGSSYATWLYPNSVAVDMTGTHLVVASSNANKATVYAIAAGTGALTLKINFDTGLYPTHVAFQRLP